MKLKAMKKNFKLITQLTFKDHSMNQSLAFKDLIDMKLKAMKKNFKLIYTADNMNQRSAGNMNQRADEIEIDEEEYWYSVEQERMKEEYWRLVEQLQEEHSIPNEDHLLIISTTLNIILEMEQELGYELDHESFKKMICIIYPEVCELYCILDSLYQL